MLHDHKDSLTKDEQNAVGVFMTSLKLCGHRCIPPNAPHKQDLLKAIKEVNTIDTELVLKVCKLVLGQIAQFYFTLHYLCRKNSSMRQKRKQAKQRGKRKWSTPRRGEQQLLFFSCGCCYRFWYNCLFSSSLLTPFSLISVLSKG